MQENLNLNLKNPHLNGEPFFWKAGPVGVLMLHGFTATPLEMRAAGERLHALGYSVLAPLLPGHGTRPADLNQVHWQDWVAAADAEFLRLRENCAHVFILGESMGAVAALYLATLRPEASGVLAFSPAVRVRLSRWQRLQLRLMAPVLASVPKGRLDRADAWQGYPVNPLKGVQQLLSMQQALLARIHLICMPVLVAQGRLDTTIDPRSGSIILAGIPAQIKRQLWYESSSHVVLIDEEIDTVVRDLAAFINHALASAGPGGKGSA
jgi:carboxylesterase